MLKEEVDEEDIAEVVGKWTGIPVSRLMEGEVQKLMQMEARLHERVVGQDEAITAVANAIRRARAGLQDPNRPIGSFIFLGPTGVGKTELARALAEFLFDDEHAMIRIDMSEYQEKHTVSRMIGAPPGYVGYDEAGQLTEAVRRRPVRRRALRRDREGAPRSAERAAAAARRRAADRRQGAHRRLQEHGRHHDVEPRQPVHRRALAATPSEGIRRQVTEALRQHFRPEFLNRIDEIVFFHALGLEHMKKIIDIQIAGLMKRLAERKIAVELTEAAKSLVVTEGYDPMYGARPLKRTLQRRILDPLAMKVLEGEFREGDRVVVDAVGSELKFDKARSRRGRGSPLDAAPDRIGHAALGRRAHQPHVLAEHAAGGLGRRRRPRGLAPRQSRRRRCRR